MKPPTMSSYWVLPGKFLAGGYPGAAAEQEHRTKIQDLIDAGVRDFINLMEEGEKNHNGQPFNPYIPVAQELCDGVRVHHFPIRDLSIPSIALMGTILDKINELLAEDRLIYVHCWGGVGRTGTVVGCWLIQQGRAEPDQALATLAELRQQDQERGYRASPETPEQRQFVVNWPNARPLQ